MADLHSLRVAVELPCRRCGYDLRGLHADGRCPECGLELVDSIAAKVDPEIAALPELPRPRSSAWSLLVLTIGLTVATIATSLAFATTKVYEAPPGHWRDTAAAVLPSTLPIRLVAVPPIAIAISILAAIVLASATALEALRRALLFAGLGGWLVASCLPVSNGGIVLTGCAAAATLAGIGATVRQLGARSRTYRQRASTRQPIGPLLTAVVVGVFALLVAEGLDRSLGPDAAIPFWLVAGACLAMTVIGVLYLALNVFWIWRALRAWMPLLERVVDHPDPMPARG